MRLAVIGALLSTLWAANAQTAGDVKNKELPAFVRQLADTRKSIAEGYVRWTDALKAKNLDAIMALYTDDATVLPEEEEVVSGKQAVRGFYANWFGRNDKLMDEKFEEINFMQEGDLLVECARFSGIVVKDGKEFPLRGKRLTVWQHDMQWRWRMVRDTWNTHPAP